METKLDRSHRLMAMGEMAASLAHEIRNPLGSMELYCSLLEKDLAEMPNAHRLAEKIHAGIKAIDRIISNSLQFSRDVVPQRKRIANVETLLLQVVECVQPKAESLGVTITCHHAGEVAPEVDAYLINQALLNVVFNAVEAAAESETRSARVEVQSVCGADGRWTVTVADNGKGISASEKEKIFDPFFTTKQGGTGLGLPIVHSIVSAHAGTLEFESASGLGTKFIMTIPCMATADRPAATSADGMCGDISERIQELR